MKKILLLSDTHGHLDEVMLKYIKEVDEVWHAGDIGMVSVSDEIKKYKPLRAVYGNIDGGELRKEFQESLFFTQEGVKVLMIHIGGYPGHYRQKSQELIKRYAPDLFIAGHSHILKVMYDKTNNLLFMNPGAIGKKGFHKKRTMLRFTLQKANILDLEVIELENR